MKRSLVIGALSLAVLTLVFNCSKTKDPVSANRNPGLNVHPAAFGDTTAVDAEDFHGNFIAANGWDLAACQECHDDDYSGGKAESSCLDCHVNTPEDCSTCHGFPPGGEHPQLTQCSACHGAVVDENNNIISDSLHANGEVNAMAFHPVGWLDGNSSDFHGIAIRNDQWNLSNCQQCHGSDYAGGTSGVSCLTCHQNTPEDCAVCHGGTDNQFGAPPEDIDGNTATTFTGVGAHTAHLSEGTFSSGFDCSSCHVVPTTFNATGHVDSDLPAEVEFSGLSLTGGVNPQWDGQSESCQNTYCHGNSAPLWTTVDGSQDDCGTCHGLPPGGDHPQSTQCSTCHGSVVDENNNIIDKSLHVNGEVDAMSFHPAGWLNSSSDDFHGVAIRNNSWDMSNCQGCHGTDYAGGTTGVTCLTCHQNTPEDCTVCHGGTDNDTGAPPEDIDGNTATTETGVGAHTAHLTEGDVSEGFDCTDCHVVPNAFSDAGHVDSDLPAEVTFSGLTLTGGVNPQWDGQSCQNTYCHGNNAPLWTTVDGSQDACGTCHGLPPADDHPQGEIVEDCSLCHGDVVDENRNIINKALHINAETEAQAHPDGWIVGHRQYLAENQWDLSNCQQCHGSDYAGGITEETCLTCHSNTPEDCTVCHGGTDNMTGAPPEDLSGNTDIASRGVGVHTAHLTASSLSAALDCESCHVVPSAFDDAGHVGSDLPAELTFGDLAKTSGVTPSWDTNNLTCADSYCHGNWSLAKSESGFGNIYSADNMTGNNASPTWTDASSAACGSCHGLPPTSHNPFDLDACANCHGTVIDASGEIIDNTKHINGMINVFNTEYPMF